MEAHHNEVEPQTVEAVIVQAADALSGARPGARGESLESYVTRLRNLEHIAREVWNEYFAPVFGARDVTLLAIYSHTINNMLYLPDYPLGHMIALQVEMTREMKTWTIWTISLTTRTTRKSREGPWMKLSVRRNGRKEGDWRRKGAMLCDLVLSCPALMLGEMIFSILSVCALTKLD